MREVEMTEPGQFTCCRKPGPLMIALVVGMSYPDDQDSDTILRDGCRSRSRADRFSNSVSDSREEPFFRRSVVRARVVWPGRRLARGDR